MRLLIQAAAPSKAAAAVTAGRLCARPLPSLAPLVPPSLHARKSAAAAAAVGVVPPRFTYTGTWGSGLHHHHQQQQQQVRAAGTLMRASHSSSSSSSSSNSSSRRVVLTAGAASVCLCAGVLPLGWRGSLSAAAAAGQAGSSRRSMATAAAGGAGGPAAADTGVLVVYVTAPHAEVAGSIAEQLVTAKLAACVNILPGITSIYSWKGKVEKDSEVLMIIKTQAALLDTLTAKVKELHPYDEPEVVGLPVVGGSASYLKWVQDSTAL